jgi:hypothetical protein
MEGARASPAWAVCSRPDTSNGTQGDMIRKVTAAYIEQLDARILETEQRVVEQTERLKMKKEAGHSVEQSESLLYSLSSSLETLKQLREFSWRVFTEG